MNAAEKIVMLMIFLAITPIAFAKERIGFAQQMADGRVCRFNCNFYSFRSTGSLKMHWYPSAACMIDHLQTNRTCKIWAIMPLCGIKASAMSPAWHYSQKPSSPKHETSTRYSVRFVAANAENDFSVRAMNVFDLDAGDVFPQFGREGVDDVSSLEMSLLGRHDDLPTNFVDGVLCSSGRIGLSAESQVLMYSLCAFAGGECRFAWSVNGLTDCSYECFYCRGGKLYDRAGKKIIGSQSRNGDLSWNSTIRLIDSDMISIPISRIYRRMDANKCKDEDVRISLSNLSSILDWLSKPEDTRGAWKSVKDCSLEERLIF